jgi:hypothetical protein
MIVRASTLSSARAYNRANIAHNSRSCQVYMGKSILVYVGTPWIKSVASFHNYFVGGMGMCMNCRTESVWNIWIYEI